MKRVNPEYRRQVARAAKAGLRVVTIRLFAEDVAAIKRRAKLEGVEWQVRARLIFRDAVRRLDRKPAVAS